MFENKNDDYKDEEETKKELIDKDVDLRLMNE